MGKWLKSPKELVFEVRDRVAYMMLNRPEKRNASSINLHREFVATCMEGGGRSERGAGRGLQATHKRIVNVGLELMGWQNLPRLAAETTDAPLCRTSSGNSSTTPASWASKRPCGNATRLC